MHHLKILEAVHNTRRGVDIKADEYLVEDVSGAQILALADGGTMTPVKPAEYGTFDESRDWNNKRILIVRTGGFGDLVLLTPIPREIKRRWPKATVHISTTYSYRSVIKELSFIDDVIDYPIKRSIASSYDAVVFLEKAIERNPLAHKLHTTDLFASIVGLTGKFDKKPEYQVSKQEIMWVLEGYPRTPGVQRVCIQPATGAECRNYPADQMSLVMVELHKRGWEIFILGEPGMLQIQSGERLRNMSQAGLTFRQSCALMDNSDLLIGGDSALIHIAGARGLPAIGLYGPFPSDLRTRYCPTTVAFDGKGSCAPCFHHVNPSKGNSWPDKGPCAKSGICDVLNTIKPMRVVEKAIKIARKFELREL